MLAVAHGSKGVADQCAPSLEPVLTELSLTGFFVVAGYVVAMTDYEGLGTPGVHPYVSGVSEGRGTLDAVKAARQLPGAAAGNRLAIAGMSQGAHGALWAGEIAHDWAPELEHFATFAGAPATDLQIAGVPTAESAGYRYLLIAGYADAYPEADPATVLTPEGLSHLDAVDQGCVTDVLTTFAALDPSSLFVPGGFEQAPWPELFAANNPGQATTQAPILIVHSAADQTVLPERSEALAARLCSMGQVLERVVLTDGSSHDASTIPAYFMAFDWIQARLAGTPVMSTC